MLRRHVAITTPTIHLQIRTFIDARIPWHRDRALDHVVEREKHLPPFLHLKNLLLSSPTHSLPLTTVSSNPTIPFPFRPIRFIRLFPSAFCENPPHPATISATPPLISLHHEETQAINHNKPYLADNLLKLLMLSPSRSLPLSLIDSLCSDLGLPFDYVTSVLPYYPDYFNIAGNRNDGSLDIEVVCYKKDLAVSAMEIYAAKTGGYKKGDAIPFPLSFPRGFDMEKKVRKWVDEWQRLPYLSPYEDGGHLAPKSDFAEKRTVAVLHEVLSLMVGKKLEKEKLVKVGERLRLPPGFRKVIVHHPGIFYVSNKLRTQTVVLREAYRRHLLVERSLLMGLRYRYLHLMHLGKEEEGKGKKKDRKAGKGRKTVRDDGNVDEEEEFDDNEKEDSDDREGLPMDAGIDSEDDESDDDDDVVVEEVGWSQSGETQLPMRHMRQRRMAV